MGKQRQAVGKRGESKTISSTSEETDKERRRVIDTVQQVQRESHAGSSPRIQTCRVQEQLHETHT